MYISGAKNKVSDAISRRPVGPLDPPQLQLSDSEDEHNITGGTEAQNNLDVVPFQNNGNTTIASALDSLQVITWDKIKLATSSDQEMEEMLALVESGFPTCKADLPGNLQKFFRHRKDLSVYDNVLLYKNRIVVPKSLQADILSLLHCSHQGVARMICRAETSVFWPGITADLHRIRSMCTACNQMAPSQPQIILQLLCGLFWSARPLDINNHRR